MHDAEPNAAYGRAVTLTEGPFAGWTTWSAGADPYETLVGPFCFRVTESGEALSAFAPEPRHLNGGGAIHGGALMSFADFALFSIAHVVLKGDVNAVTLTLNGEFVAAGDLSAHVEARGEVIRETGSLVFARGLITQSERVLLAFSGTLKKLKRTG